MSNRRRRGTEVEQGGGEIFFSTASVAYATTRMSLSRRRRRPARTGWTADRMLGSFASIITSAAVVSGLLQMDQVPNRITNERSATFSYVCTPLDVAVEDSCNVKWSLDSGSWVATMKANASVTVEDLLDGVHTFSLKHDYTADGRSETENADYTWTVDTVPPDTIVDTGPSQEGEAPRPEEADPFLFFTFHCSEDQCTYRYQFDNRIELTAAWSAADGNGLEGQVSVTQINGDEEDGLAKLQISVFLTAAGSYNDPDDPPLMPSTVSIFDTGGVVLAGVEADGSSSSSGSGVSVGVGGIGHNGTASAVGVGSDDDVDGSSSALIVREGGEGALVVLTLGSPEVDSGTGNIVFSLSAEVEVPGLIELNSTLLVEVSTNSSVLLASAPLEESMTNKEWLRWPYASELPGTHMVAIAAVDEAGNVDPEPAVWTWSVDARPRTSLTSAPQAVTPVNSAFFSFSCALPGTEAAPSPPEHNALAGDLQSVGDGNVTAHDNGFVGGATTSDKEEEEVGHAKGDEQEKDGEESDGGWAIQEGGECTYFYSLDGGDYLEVEPAVTHGEAASSSTAAGSVGASSSSSSSTTTTSPANTLLLTGLSDGVHELSVYACNKSNSSECDPQPLAHSWETDTSAPETTIVSFPDKLTPSVFSFGSSKPLSRFVCRVDGGQWRECEATYEVALNDGYHSLAVMAVDPTGRPDPTPVHYSWEVSMLETVVEYCPPSHLAFGTAETQILVGASYNGFPCVSAMSCQVRYVLEWETPAPASASVGGECVAPPSPAPTPAPVPSETLSPTTGSEGASSDSGGGGSSESYGDGDGNGSGGGDGGAPAPAATPGPTEFGDSGGDDDGSVTGGDQADGLSSSPGQNYLSRSVVQCAEGWASCTTVAANTTYRLEAGANSTECKKLETLVGEVGHSHGTLIMRTLSVGDYNLTLEAFNMFGVVDRSPVSCAFRVLAEGETTNLTQITMVRTPPKVLNNPNQTPVLFEFEVEDVPDSTNTTHGNSSSMADATTNTTANATSDGSSSSVAEDVAAEPRLSYLISGPGADEEWEDVPAVSRKEWEALLALSAAHNGTSSHASSNEGGGGGGGGDSGSGSGMNRGDYVWGLELEDLEDGEYRLQVRDEIFGDTAEYTWRVDMSVPQLTVDAVPQNPSHSADSVFVFRCSKLSCGLELQLNDDGVWHVWNNAEEEAEHGNGPGSPTPSPAAADSAESSGLVPTASSSSESSETETDTGGAATTGGGDSGDGGDGGDGGVSSGNGDGEAGAGTSGSVGDGGTSSSGTGSDNGDGAGANSYAGVGANGSDGDDSMDEDDAMLVTIDAEQVSSHELAFRVNVTVPESGNYSLAARPSSTSVSSITASATGSSFGALGLSTSPSGLAETRSDDGNSGSRRLKDSASSSSAPSDQNGDGDDTSILTLTWEVDLTRPETLVVSRPSPVTTAGVAVFQFACSLAGADPPQGCFYQYQYQMTAVDAEVDWDNLDWLPTADSVKLYEIGEGVNRIRVRAHDEDTELYDLAPVEVVWVRDATPPLLTWLWTPEEVSHLSETLFEFTCSGEVPFASAILGLEDDAEHLVNATANPPVSHSPFSSSSSSSHSPPSLRSSSASSASSMSSSVGGTSATSGDQASADDDGSAALAAAYPAAFPRVLPSGCAYEASLDGAEFEAVPDTVSLTGLSNGDHRFSVRASDLAGNVADTLHFDWTVDTKVPDTVVMAEPAEVASSNLGSFRIQDTVGAQQGKGHFEYRLDPSSDNDSWVSTSNTTLAFEGLLDGEHTLTVRARETQAEGGSSDEVPKVITWTVDTQCPDTTFVVLPDVVTHLTSTVLVVEGGPDAASFEYVLDELGSVVAGTDGDDDVGDDGGDGGDDELHEDGAAVSSGAASGARSSAGGSGGSGGSSSTSLSPSSSSMGSGKQGEGDEAVVWRKGDSSGVIHLHQLKEGRHEIRVRTVDSAGNADPSPATYSWIVDRAGVYGHPSMVTDVVAEGGNKQAFVRWSPVADDGGGALTKYVVIAVTAYADINVETITTVHAPDVSSTSAATDDDSSATQGDGGGVLPTEAVVEGLRNGLVYSFRVVAANAFGYSAQSLPSNKIVTYDPADPCGLVTCSDHGSCFIQRSESNALRGYCVCHPGYSGSDCSVVASGTDDSSLVLGAYPGSWGECDMKCGGGVRYRTVQCLQYLDGIPMSALSNDTVCWEELEVTPASRIAMSETTCRNVACLAMFLDVTMRLRAFYDDACFTVAAQDAFLSGFAAEVAHALNIKVELVIDLNAFHTNKHNEMEVRFIIAPGTSGADQPIENLREQLLLQAASETSSFRSHGTWTRKLIPDSVEVSQGTYELPPLNVTGIASDLVMILMVVGTACLGVAVYGACSSRRSKKWESVYDGEYGFDGPESQESFPNGDAGRRGGDYAGRNIDSISGCSGYRNGAGSGGVGNSNRSGDGGESGGNATAVEGTSGGEGGGPVRRNRWFELEDDSEDYDSDDDWDDEDDEDENSPFFGRCALRSLLCREDDYLSGKNKAGNDAERPGMGDDSSDGDKNTKGSSGCRCTCECGGGGGGLEGGGGRESGVAPAADRKVAGAGAGGSGGGSASGCCCCTCSGDSAVDGIELTQGPALDRSSVDLKKLPLPLTGRNRPPPPPRLGEAVLHRRRGWGFGGGSSRVGPPSSAAARREEDDGGGTVVRARGMGGESGAGCVAGRGSGGGDSDARVGGGRGEQYSDVLGVQRPGSQALV